MTNAQIFTLSIIFIAGFLFSLFCVMCNGANKEMNERKKRIDEINQNFDFMENNDASELNGLITWKKKKKAAYAPKNQ